MGLCQKVKIFAYISEVDISKISINDTAQINIDSLPGEAFSGRVDTIGLKADESTRTFPVEIIINNDQQRLLPGMIAQFSIASAKPKKAILIPQDAIRMANGVKTVYIMNNGKLSQRRVNTGAVIGSNVIIEAGLSEGEALVVSDVVNDADVIP